MSRRVIKFYGPPGTGKTTRLLREMEDCIQAGARPNKIGFISFTKKATHEALTRATRKFSLSEKQLPHFRTIHSMVFRLLALRKDGVMQWRNYNELGAKLGIQFSGRSMVEDGSMYGMSRGDRILFIEALSRSKKLPLRSVWEESNEDIDWFELDLYARALRSYKEARQLCDFTDMLHQFSLFGERLAPELDVLFIDEAQDCSLAQWDVLKILMSKAKVVYVAGDDDQCIYNWAGADVNSFLHLPGTEEVLSQSHARPPRAVHKAAKTVSARIKNRKAKVWNSAATEGSLNWHNAPHDVDMSKGTWLLMARNGYMLAELEQMCIDQGWSFKSVGQSPLDDPALRAILIWEHLRAGKEARPDDVEKVLNYVDGGAAARQALRSRLNDAPLRLDDVRGLGLRGLGAVGSAAPIWYSALRRIAPELRDYYIAARKRGETLTKAPRVTISTIHAAKGGEAENVMLLTDVSQRSFLSMQKNPDDENRVLYVGMTRTMENLHLIQPKTPMFFEL